MHRRGSKARMRAGVFVRALPRVALSVLFVLLAGVATGAAAQARGAHDEALAALTESFRERSFDRLAAWLAADFAIGTVDREQSRAVLRRLIESGARVPETMRLDSAAADPGDARLFVTITWTGGQERQVQMRVDEHGRFSDLGLFRVEPVDPAQRSIGGAEGPGGAAMVLGRIGGERDVPDPDYRRALLELAERDQRHRGQLGGAVADTTRERLWQQQSALDEENITRLAALLEQRGWPRRSEVGDDAAIAAFLVLQHAALETQKRYLPLLREQARAGELAPGALALYEDRIDVREGRPQAYGTQVRTNPETGELEPYPLKDAARVDELRASVGLPPLEVYLRMLKERGGEPSGS